MSTVPYQTVFADLVEELPGNRRARERAAESMAFPMRRDEAWRFTSARKLLSTEHTPTTGSMGDLPEDVHALFDAMDHPAIAKLGRASNKEGFQALNLAFFREGALVFVDADDALEGVRIPVAGNEGLTTPRVLIVVEEDAELELYIDHTLGSGLHVPVVEIFAGKRSKVSVTQVVRGDGGQAVCHIAAKLGKFSEVNVHSVVLGGDIVRVELFTSGEGKSTLNTSGLVLARGKSHVDHHLDLQHDANDMVSHQTFRNILDDKARAVFTGLVTVGKNVTGSDATQNANTLLLADGASCVARPWLEIHNDDVVASHGATVGRLDDESLFYLQSRGIPTSQARKMLTTAFAVEIVHGIPEAYRASLEDDVQAWLLA